MGTRQLVYRKGARIAFEREGEGPLVVLVQGLGLSGRMWMQTPARVASLGFTVVTPDNRGTGLSEVSPPPYRMAVLADDIARVIEHVGGGPAIVAGISLGGMIAQHVALRHRALVRGLVLAATTCGGPFGRLARPRVLSVMIRGLLGDRGALPALRSALVHEASLRRNPDLFVEWNRMLMVERVRWQAVLGQLAAAAGHNTYFGLARVRCPTEILTGDTDEIVPTINASVLARRIAGARHTVLTSAGHAFPLEQPEAIPDAIVRVHARAAAASPG